LPCIRNLNEEAWEIAVSASNAAAMQKKHAYPTYEESFFEQCLEYVDLTCADGCQCRENGSDKVWVVKRDLEFEVFLRHYADLWVRGSARFIDKVNNEAIDIGRRDRNSVPLLRYIRAKWDNWDGDGNSLPHLANQHRNSLFCDNAFAVIEAMREQIQCHVVDNTGVYTSKLLSQLFPDVVIPFDTQSRLNMIYCGYNPAQLGNGAIRNETLQYVSDHELDICDLRRLDNAMTCCWPNQGALVAQIGVPTTYSRVIDKLFYGQ
jgi:hypothetical protein